MTKFDVLAQFIAETALSEVERGNVLGKRARFGDESNELLVHMSECTGRQALLNDIVLKITEIRHG